MTKKADGPSGEHGAVALKSESRLPVPAGIQVFKAPWMAVFPTGVLILLVCQVIGDPAKM